MNLFEFKNTTFIYLFDGAITGFNPQFLFVLSFISIFSGLLIIISKNPIISVLYLILLFSSISCYLIFIGVKFIGISYLLVYVGAVSILFLFILMLINIRVSELIGDTNNNIPLAIMAVLIFFVPYTNALPYDKKTNSYLNNLTLAGNDQINIKIVSSNNWDGNIMDNSDIMSIGNIMYTSYSMWLLITSLILLLAMVGSIVITIKQKN